MATASIDLDKHILMVFGIILASGPVSAAIARRLRVPDVVVFLILGMLLGPSVAGLIVIKAESALNQLVLIFGSCYILFDGGASLRFKVLREVWITIVVLATAGVVITAVITGIAAYYLLGVPLIVAMLLASTIASTDPATLLPVLQQVKIKERVAQTVMSESAFNDATGAMLTFAVLAIAMRQGEFSVATALFGLLKQASIGLTAGAVLGYVGAMLIAHERFGFLQVHAPIVSLMAVIAAYLGADGLAASGFMAVFVFGIMIGNKEAFGLSMERGEQEKLDDFVVTTALIMRMSIFILLGSQVDFALMNKYLLGGVAVAAVLMLVARPVAVFLCALADRRVNWTFKEMLFMCWTRETGVMPGALAGLLLGMGAPGAKVIVSVTFIAILMTILIQAATTRWLAEKLDLLVVETDPP